MSITSFFGTENLPIQVFRENGHVWYPRYQFTVTSNPQNSEECILFQVWNRQLSRKFSGQVYSPLIPELSLSKGTRIYVNNSGIFRFARKFEFLWNSISLQATLNPNTSCIVSKDGKLSLETSYWIAQSQPEIKHSPNCFKDLKWL